mgnify:CR=1 FL=1
MYHKLAGQIKVKNIYFIKIVGKAPTFIDFPFNTKNSIFGVKFYYYDNGC